MTETGTTTLVIMGVSGSGKTTIARELVERLGWTFAEGDDFHPPANVEKMRSGQPLDDEARRSWLGSIAAWIGEREAAGENAIVTCSALKRGFRDLLRDGHPSVLFVHVDVSRDILRKRLGSRKGHYMPASLLDSQLATLEPLQADEPGFTVPGDEPPDEVADRVVRELRTLSRDRPRVGDEPGSVPDAPGVPPGARFSCQNDTTREELP